MPRCWLVLVLSFCDLFVIVLGSVLDRFGIFWGSCWVFVKANMVFRNHWDSVVGYCISQTDVFEILSGGLHKIRDHCGGIGCFSVKKS